jgi:C4-dicarboxylate transporter DctM subunit
LSLPPVIFGGIYMGIFTVTEAAAVSAVQALLIGFLVYRNLSWRDVFEAALSAVRLSAILFMIIAAAVMFGTVLTLLGVPQQLTQWVTAAGFGKYGFLVTVGILLLILGMFLESVALILIVTPIVLPTLAALGVDLVWFGIQFVILLEVAQLTPPVGMNLFVLRAVTGAPLGKIVTGSLPFVVLLILGWAAVIAFRQRCWRRAPDRARTNEMWHAASGLWAHICFERRGAVSPQHKTGNETALKLRTWNGLDPRSRRCGS